MQTSAAASHWFGDRMPAMRLVTTGQPRHRKTREWMLAWLACGSFASSAGVAQTDVDSIPPLSPPDETAAEAQVSPDAGSAELVLADPDPVATNERLVATNIEAFGRKSLPVAEAYVDLADAQRRAKEYE